MKRISEFIKSDSLLFCSIILASFLRFFWLDMVPPAIGGDELIYVITSKFVYLRWTDILGTWNPLSVFLFHYPFGQFQAELPYFLFLPFLKFSSIIVNTKFVFSLISIATVFIIYLLTKELFGKRVAVVASFIAAINPWFIFIGRTAYEVVPATFFYLFSLYILVRVKGKNILWSIPVLFFAFYSYIGTKLIFFPFVAIVLLYAYYSNKKKYQKQYLIVGLFSLLLTLFFIFSLKTNQSLSRTSEIFSINDPKVSQIVDETRKRSIENPLTSIFVNKGTAFLGVLNTKFFTTLSFDYLFLNGDDFYSVYTHGLFYPIDALFLLFGLLFVFAKEKKKLFFLFSLAMLSLIPQIFHTADTANFTPHMALFFPFMIIFIACGIIYFSEMFKKNIKNMALFIIAFAYLLSMLNFLNIYFFQYPLRETFDFRIRLLSKYLNAVNPGEQVTVYTTRSSDMFMKYLYYTQNITKGNLDKISYAFKNRKYTLGNVTFTDCNTPNLSKDFSVIDFVCGDYGTNVKHVAIADLLDGFQTFRIYNDSVCSGIGLKPFPSGITISDFSVEKLSKEAFCRAFVTSSD